MIFSKATFVALLGVLCMQGRAEEEENAGTLDMKQFEPLEEKVLGKILEKDDGPFERKIKQLVAHYLLSTAIDEATGGETYPEDNGRALLQGNYYPQQPQQQQPQIVYVYGTPPTTAPTGRTRRTRRPGHHHHHNRESSEERRTQAPPQPVIQPIYIPQQQQPYPPQQQPPYNPQYQPQYPQQQQPPYNPQFPVQQQQPQYQPQQPQYQPQPGYQPQPQYPQNQQRPASSVDLPQDSLGGTGGGQASQPSQIQQPLNQLSNTTAAPAPSQNSSVVVTTRPLQQQQPIHSHYPAPASPSQQGQPSYPSQPAQGYPYPPQSSQQYPAPGQPQQQYPYPQQQRPQAPAPVQVVYLEPTLAPGQTTTPATTTSPRPTPSREHVYNQVNKILDNVAWGNITGIVDNALGIRTPMPTRMFVNGILNTVFCSPINRLLGRCRG